MDVGLFNVVVVVVVLGGEVPGDGMVEDAEVAIGVGTTTTEQQPCCCCC